MLWAPWWDLQRILPETHRLQALLSLLVPFSHLLPRCIVVLDDFIHFFQIGLHVRVLYFALLPPLLDAGFRSCILGVQRCQV